MCILVKFRIIFPPIRKFWLHWMIMCCVFWPVFGCCALVKTVFSAIFNLFVNFKPFSMISCLKSNWKQHPKLIETHNNYGSNFQTFASQVPLLFLLKISAQLASYFKLKLKKILQSGKYECHGRFRPCLRISVIALSVFHNSPLDLNWN